MHSAVAVSLTHEPYLKKKFPPHKSLPPQLFPLHIQYCIAGKVSQSLSFLHKQEGNFSSLSNKSLNKVFVAFLGTSQETPSRVVALQGSTGGDEVWKESFV